MLRAWHPEHTAGVINLGVKRAVLANASQTLGQLAIKDMQVGAWCKPRSCLSHHQVIALATGLIEAHGLRRYAQGGGQVCRNGVGVFLGLGQVLRVEVEEQVTCLSRCLEQAGYVLKVLFFWHQEGERAHEVSSVRLG